ncbi:MAG TPA: Hsp20/alpha crystallin family protein [Thermoanaerobaculia bacterium]|nr:Hsp20/alpha crystallin family protein [Thermoanaerobaculia bacterium]
MPDTPEMTGTETGAPQQSTTHQPATGTPTASATAGQTSASPQGGYPQTPQTGQPGQPAMSHRGRGPMTPWDMAMSGNPFGMMRQFADEMDRLFESFGFPSFGRQWPGRNVVSNLEQQQDVQGVSSAGGPGGAMSRPQGGGAFWAPQIDVSRRGNELVVCADLPGMNREDVNVEVRDGQLILQGERRWQQEQGGEAEGYYRSERSYGRFFRTVPLPDGVNPEQAQATFKDGVLEVKMPLPEQHEQRGRKIEIR